MTTSWTKLQNWLQKTQNWEKIEFSVRSFFLNKKRKLLSTDYIHTPKKVQKIMWLSIWQWNDIAENLVSSLNAEHPKGNFLLLFILNANWVFCSVPLLSFVLFTFFISADFCRHTSRALSNIWEVSRKIFLLI